MRTDRTLAFGVVALLVLPAATHASAQPRQWVSQFGTPGFDAIYALDGVGGDIYGVGETEGELADQMWAGSCDVVVRAYTGTGEVRWTRQFGSRGCDVGEGIAATADGVYVGGSVELLRPDESPSGVSDAFVRRYDTDGNEVWTRQFGTGDFVHVAGAAPARDGVYVVGQVCGALPGQAPSGRCDAFARRYDPDGTPRRIVTRDDDPAVFSRQRKDWHVTRHTRFPSGSRHESPSTGRDLATRQEVAMRKLILVAVAVSLLAAGPATAADPASHAPRPDGTVWVTERALGSVVAFDAGTGTVLGSARTGAAPIGVTVPHGTGRVYTSDEGSNQVSVIDRRTFARVSTIPMGPRPHHLMANADGTRIFVAEFGANQIGVIDTTTNRRIGVFVASPLAEARTHAVFVTGDGRYLYAANTRADRTQPGDIAKLDARTGIRLWEDNLPIGTDPSEVLVTPDGSTAYVSVRGENRIKEVDVSGDTPVMTRETVVGSQPDTLQLANDGATLVVTLRGTPAQVSLVDTATFAVRTVTIPGHTTTGHHWLSANGRLTYVAVESPGGVAVIDNRTGHVLADHPYPDPPGGSRPHGVFAEPQQLSRS